MDEREFSMKVVMLLLSKMPDKKLTFDKHELELIHHGEFAYEHNKEDITIYLK